MTEFPEWLPFVKVHGSGNDFVLVDELDDFQLAEEARAPLARLVCHRESGLGADGVLFVQRSGNGRARMRVFNPDGSEPEMCGNGLRCVGRYLAERKEIPLPATVDTLRGPMYVASAGERDGVQLIRIRFDAISLRPADLPMVWEGDQCIEQEVPIQGLSEAVRLTALSLYNPHAVVMTDAPVVREEVERIGQAVNPSDRFPNGVNVSFVRVAGQRALEVITYERGVGITSSCGTGMTAATIAAMITGRMPAEEEIEVRTDGGIVWCTAGGSPGALTATLTGNATFPFEGVAVIRETTPGPAAVGLRERVDHPAEAHAWERFVAAVRRSRSA